MADKPMTFKRARTIRMQQLKSKSIAGTVIVGRFCNCLGLPPGVDPKKSVDDLLGGNLERWDLGLNLMRYPLFKQDGLILQKADVVKAATVGRLGDLVFKWYIADGWTVS